MRLPDVLPPEDLSNRWWIDWLTVDFSWESLQRKHLGNEEEQRVGQTLQDYWRTDPVTETRRGDDILTEEGELEQDPLGNPWHLVHVPLHWSNGSPTWKAERNHPNWQKFWKIIRSRLDKACVPLGSKPAGERPAPAILSGIVFGCPPEDWTWEMDLSQLNAEFQTCAFLGGVSFYGVEPVSTLDLRYSLFSGIADLDEVITDGDLRIEKATFLSHLKMKNVSIGGNLIMDGCNVRGEFSLLAGRVGGRTRSRLAVFHGPCGFEGTTFGSEVTIAWCRFLNVTSFASVRFRERATFLNSTFLTDILVTGRCHREFSFVDCESHGTHFAQIVVRREASFAATRFRGPTLFQAARFRGKASFLNSIFEAETRFRQVGFCAEVEFHNAVFDSVADFSSCHFPEDARLHHCAFKGADFRRNVDFSMEGFSAWGAFAECTFHQRVLFSRRTLAEAAYTKVAFHAAERAVKDVDSDDPKRRALEIHQRFSELQASFQSLKQGMARQQARLDEHRFYRLELLAHKRYASARIHRFMIWLYDTASLCGTSFARPLLFLVISMLLFGFGYWASTRTTSELVVALNPFPLRSFDASFVDAIRFSVENTFQPMSVWEGAPSVDHPRNAWVQALLTEGSTMRYLSIRLIATLQSFAAITLLFLTALGLKRHFQMST